MKYFIYNLLSLLLLLGACSRGGGTSAIDADGDDDDAEVPVVVSLARSTVSGDDEILTKFKEGTNIGVKIDDTWHEYACGADGTTFTEANADEKVFFGQGVESVAVEAYYPYNADGYGYLHLKSSQEKTTNGESNYYLSDVLHTVGTINREPLTPLTFYHVMSKLIFTVKSEDTGNPTVITSLAVGEQYLNARFQFNGNGEVDQMPTFDGTKTSVTAMVADDGKSCRAIIIPRGNVSLPLTLTVGGETYTVTLPSNTFQPGMQYTYTITVKDKELEVKLTSSSTNWTETSFTPAPSMIRVRVTGMPANATVDGLDNVMEGVDEYTVRTNPFTITTPGTDKIVSAMRGVCDETRVANGNDMTSTFLAHSDLWLEYIKMPEVGDYYYSDGTWSADYKAGSNPACIGVVFQVGAGTGGKVDYYGGKVGCIHGYVVALKDDTSEDYYFGDDNMGSLTENWNNFLGYRVTLELQNHTNFNKTWTSYKAVSYTPAAPATSSGWYLASPGEWKALWKVYGTVKEKIIAAGGEKMYSCWTAGRSGGTPCYVNFGEWAADKEIEIKHSDWGSARVRSILAF